MRLSATGLLATLAAGGIVLSVATARAAEPLTIRTDTTGELADTCGVDPKSAGADARINFCHGYAQGAITVQRHYAGGKKLFCMPSPGPSRAETMNQFVGWVRANSDRRSLPSDEGLFKFLQDRYPCGA